MKTIFYVHFEIHIDFFMDLILRKNTSRIRGKSHLNANSTVEGELSVWRWYIISTMEDMQYGPVPSSIRRRMCSTGLPKLLRV